VYRWTNKITGSSYIGSSVNLTRRFRTYFDKACMQCNAMQFLKNSRHKMIIYKALLKNGYSNFILDILEYCEPASTLGIEQYYFDWLKPDYNILRTAGSSLGYRHSEETLAKLKYRKLSPEAPIRGKIESSSG
jgi:group I intron endonuclease